MNIEKQIIDLDNPEFYTVSPDYSKDFLKIKGNENYRPIDNKFGWNVFCAEIHIDKQSKILVEYRLLSKDNTEQCHARKVETENLTYWHFEFLDRQLNVSPDPFEPQLQTFLEYHYRENTEELLDKELSFPVVSYAILDKQKLLRVRYALSANQMYSKPLFHVLVLDGYLTAITDWQNPDKMKNILIPIENVNGIQEKSIVFHSSFNDYQVKYRMDSQLETKLKKQDFFALEKIINDAVILLTYIPTINYHLIKSCNMKCRHCFSDYNEIEKSQLPFEEAKQIIQEVAKIKSFKKLNFSGGEPTLFTKIEQLIAFAKEQDLETSMVSNGYNLIKNDSILDKLKGCLDLLALSIDSFDHKLNIEIGRYVGKEQKTISYDDFLQLTQKCSEYGIKIKVNTVVTKLNCNEILADKIVTFYPIRWKILRMLPIKSQNDEAKKYFPTEEEYRIFVEHNRENAENAGIKVVTEDNEDMTGSYLMISPDGRFFHNMKGCHKYSDPILKVGMEKALQQTPLRREIFYKRGGDYSCD